MRSLFEQVVDCCGLAPAFASKIIREACERSGVTPETMSPAELIRTLPQIQQALSVFLDPHEVAQKTSAMRGLVRASWPAMQAVKPPVAETESRSFQEEPNMKATSSRGS
jgi:hypothetical protein